MNIVLIGYRGTGKSTIADRLSKLLDMRVVCMDEEIVRRAGQAIPQIVEQHGWDHFRNIESDLAAELGKEDGLIIDAGGGVIVRQQNIDNLKENGAIFWLMADEETIADRIQDDTQRPSLTGSKSFVEEIADVLAERTPKYKAASDYTIDTAEKSIEEAAQAIADIFSGS